MEKGGERDQKVEEANNFEVPFSALRKDVANVVDFMERLNSEEDQIDVDMADQIEKLKFWLASICAYVQLSYSKLILFEDRMTALRQEVYNMHHVLPSIMDSIDDCINSCPRSKSRATMTDEQLNFLLLNLHHLSKFCAGKIFPLVTEYEILQKVLDYIEDIGLEEIAKHYKDLEELRVFPYMQQPSISLTERGLVPISAGFPKLHSVLYFSRQMTNSTLVTGNCPNLIRIHLCLLEPQSPDYLTLGLLDTVSGAIVHHCKGLRRLSPSDLLTDHVFHYIGTHSKNLEMLSVLFAVNSDLGLHYVLSGCESFYNWRKGSVG